MSCARNRKRSIEGIKPKELARHRDEPASKKVTKNGRARTYLR